MVFSFIPRPLSVNVIHCPVSVAIKIMCRRIEVKFCEEERPSPQIIYQLNGIVFCLGRLLIIGCVLFLWCLGLRQFLLAHRALFELFASACSRGRIAIRNGLHPSQDALQPFLICRMKTLRTTCDCVIIEKLLPFELVNPTEWRDAVHDGRQSCITFFQGIEFVFGI